MDFAPTDIMQKYFSTLRGYGTSEGQDGTMQLRKIQLGLVLIAGLLLTTAVVKSQMPTGVPPVGPVWEYTAISSLGQEARGVNAATASLGEKGWELAAVSDHIMYFKRLKSAIHRND
jgi:hypothetical protein